MGRNEGNENVKYAEDKTLNLNLSTELNESNDDDYEFMAILFSNACFSLSFCFKYH